MEHPPLAFDAPQSEYLARMLNDLYIKNDTLLAKVKGVSGGGLNNGITVTAASSIAIPDNADYFILNGTTAVNTFSAKPVGTRITVLLKSGVNLNNSANLLLKDSVKRIAFVDQYIELISVGSGIWQEVGDNVPSIIDLTGYTGADIALCRGQTAVYSVTAITALALRIATGDKQGYELWILPDNPTGAGTSVFGVAATISPNNAAAINWAYTYIYASENTPTAAKTAGSLIQLGSGYTLVGFMVRISTSTKSKQVQSNFYSLSNIANISGSVHNYAADVTTNWTSMGTVNINTMTGTVKVTRVL
jgi:hypothetical protein